MWDLLHLYGFLDGRSMTRVGSSVRGLVYAFLVAFAGAAIGDASAATKKTKEPAPAVVAAKPTKQPSEQGQTPSIQRVKKGPVHAVIERQPRGPKSPVPAVTEYQPEAIQKQAKQVPVDRKPTSPKSPIPAVTESQPEAMQKQAEPVPTELKSTSPKSPRRMKVHRRRAPKAVVQPRTDLMYHGMLESPQRYDPRRNHLGAGVPDPHNPELTHDHFQELDRNQDGTIDPVERTFGRPDMDRDLHDRRPR